MQKENVVLFGKTGIREECLENTTQKSLRKGSEQFHLISIHQRDLLRWSILMAELNSMAV